MLLTSSTPQNIEHNFWTDLNEFLCSIHNGREVAFMKKYVASRVYVRAPWSSNSIMLLGFVKINITTKMLEKGKKRGYKGEVNRERANSSRLSQ